MAIGRKFEEAFQKALRMTDENILGFDPDTEFTVCDKVIMQQIYGTWQLHPKLLVNTMQQNDSYL